MFHAQTMQTHLEYPGGLGVPSRDDSAQVCDNGAESVIEKTRVTVSCCGDDSESCPAQYSQETHIGWKMVVGNKLECGDVCILYVVCMLCGRG